MIKNAFLVAGVASLALSSAASARDVRPAPVNFQAGSAVTASAPAPAKTVVRKRNNLSQLAIITIVIAVAGGIGGIAAATSGGSAS